MDEYDVIVIGAGFGGPVAAKKCADAGLKTLIVERSTEPGNKVISSCIVPFYGPLAGPEWIREGDPPVERTIYGLTHHFVRDGKVYFTSRFTLPIPMGHSLYCNPFCTWLTNKAVEAGSELRLSTTATDVIKEDGYVKGVVTDEGEELRSKILIDSEGLQNFLAIKAGVRKKFIPEAIELCMLYDFEMPEKDVDSVLQNHAEYYWSMPKEKMIAPVGQGSAIYIFPYKKSIHMTAGQFLKHEGKVANTSKLLDEYYNKFFKVDRWQELYEPKVKLRAKLWDTCPLYAGLFPEMLNMKSYGNGILVVGDAAGLEAAAIGDGIPNAWISADMAADVAIEAIKSGDLSSEYLKRYEAEWRSNPLIQFTITSPFRRNLLKAQKNEGKMIRGVSEGWGLFMSDFVPMITRSLGPDSMEIIERLKDWGRKP